MWNRRLADGEDPFELATEYLDLSRRWRTGRPPLSDGDRDRRSRLREDLEVALAKGELAAPGTSKRNHLRVPTLHGVEVSNGDRRVSGRLTEIAEGGVFVATDPPLEQGTRLRLEIIVENAPIELATGAVRWARSKPSDGLPVGMGMAFEQLDDRQYETVIELMEKALRLTLAQASAGDSERS